MKLMYVLALTAGLMASLGAFDTYKEAFAAGQQAAKTKKFDEALKNYEEAEKLGANTTEKFNALSQEFYTLQTLRKFDEITVLCDRIMALEGATADQLSMAKYNKARVYFWTNKRKEGLETFLTLAKDAAMLPGHRGDLAIHAGNELRTQRKYDEAIAAYQIVTSLEKPDPNQLVTAYTNLSQIYLDKKDNAEALNMANKAVEVERVSALNRILAYSTQARCCILLEKYDDAQKAVDAGKAVKGIAPGQLIPFAIQQAAIFDAAQKYQESIDNYLEVQKTQGMPAGNVDQLNLLIGNAYLNNLKDNAKAKEYLEIAAKSANASIKKQADAQLKKIDQ